MQLTDHPRTQSLLPPELHHSTGTHAPSLSYVEVNHESCVPEREYRVQCVANLTREHSRARTIIFCCVELLTCCACTTRSSCGTAAGRRGGRSARILRRRVIALRSVRYVTAPHVMTIINAATALIHVVIVCQAVFEEMGIAAYLMQVKADKAKF